DPHTRLVCTPLTRRSSSCGNLPESSPRSGNLPQLDGAFPPAFGQAPSYTPNQHVRVTKDVARMRPHREPVTIGVVLPAGNVAQELATRSPMPVTFVFEQNAILRPAQIRHRNEFASRIGDPHIQRRLGDACSHQLKPL